MEPLSIDNQDYFLFPIEKRVLNQNNEIMPEPESNHFVKFHPFPLILI